MLCNPKPDIDYHCEVPAGWTEEPAPHFMRRSYSVRAAEPETQFAAPEIPYDQTESCEQDYPCLHDTLTPACEDIAFLARWRCYQDDAKRILETLQPHDRDDARQNVTLRIWLKAVGLSESGSKTKQALRDFPGQLREERDKIRRESESIGYIDEHESIAAENTRLEQRMLRDAILAKRDQLRQTIVDNPVKPVPSLSFKG